MLNNNLLPVFRIIILLSRSFKLNNLPKFYLKDANGVNNNFYLTNGNSGFIAFTVNRDQPRNFIEPQYYYRPIPLSQVVINPNLKQPFGW